jgi:hypothetical protein
LWIGPQLLSTLSAGRRHPRRRRDQTGEVAVKDVIIDLLGKLANLSTTNLALIVVLVALLIVWQLVSKM